MKKFLVLFLFFTFISSSYAQKYSLLIPDIIFYNQPQEFKTKLTYIMREEVSSLPYFSLINRNTTLSSLSIKTNGKKYFNKQQYIDDISETLFKNEIDYAFITIINEENSKWNINFLIIDFAGIIYEDYFQIEGNEKAFEDSIKALIAKVNSIIYFPKNENDNPYEFEEMIFIPAGPAIIGSFNGEPIEAPQRTVYVNSFYIDKYEVTNSQYKQFIDATGRKPPTNVVNPEYTIWQNGNYPEELANHPVVNVTWYDAKAYCEWKGKRLPTAIEWEKAARGPYGNIYPWGNEYFDGFANLYQKGESYITRKTVPVGTYDMSKSYYGVYDLAGNVWEWVNDTYNDKNSNTLKKLAKGGGWGYNGNKYTARASYSLIFDANYTSNCLGFRCAK
ncbi:MAG: formylglycine-generating enzyme family protein [Proteobacteria bacterium]|nr:formylglycine-generating enzyme family protein [Pseudomonadota bacterium]